jgi:hypothetical protein
VSVLLREAAPAPALPDWTGFWEGVRRGIEAPAAPVRTRLRWRPRLVAGTAAALVVGASLMLWQLPRSQAAAEISVSSANTSHPRGTVMVYSPPEKDIAVVWVFADD